MVKPLHQNCNYSVDMPANCTGHLQLLDISVNKAAKSFMHDQFQTWYAQQVQQQMEDGGTTNEPVDLQSSIVKPISAR